MNLTADDIKTCFRVNLDDSELTLCDILNGWIENKKTGQLIFTIKEGNIIKIDSKKDI